VGRLQRTGAGSLASGELVTTAWAPGPQPSIVYRDYSIGADNRGVMTLNFAGSSAKLASR